MTSLRCNVRKKVKRQGSLAQIHIFIDPMPQIIFFLVDILTMAYFFINCAEKAKFFRDS